MYSTRTFAATFAMLSCAIAQIAATDQSLKDLAASKGDEDLVAWDPTADPFIGPHIKELLSGKGCGVLHIFSNAAVRKQAAEDDGFESPWPFADNGMAPICYDGYDYKFGDIATYSTYESNKDSIYILYGHIPQDQNEDSVVVAGYLKALVARYDGDRSVANPYYKSSDEEAPKRWAQKFGKVFRAADKP